MTNHKNGRLQQSGKKCLKNRPGAGQSPDAQENKTKPQGDEQVGAGRVTYAAGRRAGTAGQKKTAQGNLTRGSRKLTTIQ